MRPITLLQICEKIDHIPYQIVILQLGTNDAVYANPKFSWECTIDTVHKYNIVNCYTDVKIS